MIINDRNWDNRADLLTKNVADLILSGESTDSILVLTLNSFKKEKLLEKIHTILINNNISSYGNLNIFTFSGIIYNSVLTNWVNIEKILSNTGGDVEIIPTLSGLDTTQYFLRKIIKEENFDDYFSKKNLMHQLLRRYKLIVENSLSDEEIAKKSAILNETFATNAHNAINGCKVISAKNRIFDNLKQLSAFLYLLKKNKINDFNKIKYFFADDADEYSYATFEFCKYMIKNTQKSMIFMDKNGCSRKGYLCGYDDVFNDLNKEFKFEVKNIINNRELIIDAENLFGNITQKQRNKLKHFQVHSFSKRLEMIENVAKEIFKLLKNGIKISDIQIITPCIDENLFYSLKELFKKENIKIQLLTGNKKIVDDIYVYAIITILELLNSKWNIKPTSFEIRILLNEILQIPIYECKELIEFYKKHSVLPEAEILQAPQYQLLLELINDENIKNITMKEQFEIIFQKIIAPNTLLNSDFEPINLLAKSINEFEKIKNNFEKYNNIILSPTDWLLHIKNSVVSQNPSKPAHIEQNSLIVSTAQKIVDFSLQSKYQFWLDTTSSEWIKEDTGTIYNAWVFQKNFNNSKFTNELNSELTLNKTARLVRKLTICASEKIYTFSSIFDSSGRENYGELADFVETEDEQPQKFNFIPRDDQKEILNYTRGKLAVPAVPGAGKTTVMLALLIELVKKGINPQNILVLTFMESAARNFLNRYKKTSSQRKNLPQISTIHAFAFKILMENNNYAYVNLPEDFSICDDSLKISIIKDICAYNLPVGENLDEWSNLIIAAISKAKISDISVEKLIKESQTDGLIKEFLTVYQHYHKKLKELSLLDYDDLLICAVKLLKTNKNVAQYYQEKYQYIIEDEAQDSNAIQQELIGILSKKYGNVIRSGDINQAILGTFSNSDVQGFKKFIAENNKVEMFRSQRCTKEIYELANSIVDYTKENPITENSFYNLKINGVEGKNPISANPINYKIEETTMNEKEFVLNDIKEKLTNSEKPPSFGILLRTNKQVSSWAAFIEKQGLKVICRGDSYKQKKIFSFILSALELFIEPWNNKLVAKFYREFCNIGKIKFVQEIFDYIEKNDDTVMQPKFLTKHQYINNDLEIFWWEAFSIAENHTLDIQEIIMFCANNYFNDVTDKSNAYLFSILVKRYTNTLNDDRKFSLNYISEIIKYFKNLFAQKTLKGINLFSKEDEDADMNGFVQIMTVHKSKGAEFDYVYLPEFTEFNYATKFTNCCKKIKKRKKPLLSKLDKIHTGKEISISQTAKSEIEETMRLIYVAVTRAKRGLTFSYSNKNEFKRDNTSVEFIENLLSTV